MFSHRFLLVSLALAGSPLAASAQTSPSIRTLASFTDRFTTDPHVSPDGRFILLPLRSELRVYNVATRQSTKIVDGPVSALEWSRRMDRIAWVRNGDEGKGSYIWTMPIDPVTAAPKGPAQRVSAGQGHHPAISVDGRWIAYQTPESTTGEATAWNQPHRLAVAAVTGGPERTIAHFPTAFEGHFWSADGKSIYAAGSPVGSPKAVITKVYLDGRNAEVIRADSAEWVPGITADRRFLVTVPARNPISAKDRAIVIDTTGREVGRVPLPVGTINEYDTPIDSALVWVGITDNRRLELRSLDGSSPRRLNTPLPAESPKWSPDGKRILFQVREETHNRLALMNTDGSNVRVLRETDVRPDAWGARWSPDSRSIVYERADWHALMLLDIASGKSRLVVEDTSSRIGHWVVGSDGKSIAAVMLRQATPTPSAVIHEIRLDGSQGALLDFSWLLPKNTGFQFIDANNVVLRSDSAVFTATLGGALKRLAAIPAGTRIISSAVSHDGKTFAGPLHDDAHPGNNQIEIVSLDYGQRRLLDMPFHVAGGMQPVFSNDDRALIVSGQRDGDTTSVHVYAVPLNGDPPRELASVGGGSGTAASFSPDEKSIVYSVQDLRTTSLLLVDLRSVMKAGAIQAGSSRKP